MNKILVVEDHKDTATLFDTYLGMFFPGWSVFRSESGEQAVLLAGEHKPEVMIVDIALNGAMDGIQVIRELKKAGIGTKVILVTALGNKASRGIRPGQPWVDQLNENEKALVAKFFEKSHMKWADLITEIAKAANVPIPDNLADLD